MKKLLLTGLAAGALVTTTSACGLVSKYQRLTYATSLFSGKEQYENFTKVPDMFPVTTLRSSAQPKLFPVAAQAPLPSEFQHDGQTVTTPRFLEETDTAALLVLHQGKLVYESYALTGGRDVTWPSWSVAKSYVSALIGVAIDDRLIKSIEDPVTAYLPELKGSGYDGVSIKDVLQMSSGARWNEDYSSSSSDINRLGRIIALGGSLDTFIATIGPDKTPGTFNRYNSADTQVLGRLLVAVTGESLSTYMEKKLWHPLGAESEGHWLIDSKGMEMAFAGFNATARDYAKLGELYRLKGKWDDKQIVPADWIAASITAQEAHLLPGENPASNNEFGYGYQWWLLDSAEEEFTAMGVYNQFIYVNPARELVIVKLSANSEFGVTDTQESYRDQETISLFRGIGEAVAPLQD